MYISKLHIQGYRCFKDITVDFNDGLNVIVGENNAGKSTLIKAIGLIFNRVGQRTLSSDDFYRWPDTYDLPPKITVSVTISGSQNERTQDKAVVASWLIRLDAPWEAMLTFSYFLPETEQAAFIKEMNSARNNYWATVDRYIPKYVSRIFGGNPEAKNRAEAEWLEKFDYHFLDAIRDAENHMFSGKNALLKRVLQRFLDNDLNSQDVDTSQAILRERKANCDSCADSLLQGVQGRIDRNSILELATQTGASIGGIPELAGKLEEADLLSVLKLVIRKEGLDFAISHNGLGYNNLIYVSLILANLDVETSSYLGDNAKVFPMLLIEEPEAHLHPAMQYKFLKFLKERVRTPEKSRQVFITTHSTHITAAVGLDPIICLSVEDGKNVRVAYPGRVFGTSDDGQKSKKYVERFLDSTKSNMLFSKGVLFVEGMAENMLLPILAELVECSIEDSHVALIRVDGVTFKHFLPIFGVGHANLTQYALRRNVACVVDADPSRKQKVHNARWKKCWPFEIGLLNEEYQYKELSGVYSNLEDASRDHSKVKIFSGVPGKAKTFEYDFVFDNADNAMILSTQCGEKVSRMIADYNQSIDSLYSIADDEELTQNLSAASWSEQEKKRALVAAIYLSDIENAKGEHAFELAYRFREALLRGEEINVRVPEHISNAIKWACRQTNNGV